MLLGVDRQAVDPQHSGDLNLGVAMNPRRRCLLVAVSVVVALASACEQSPSHQSLPNQNASGGPSVVTQSGQPGGNANRLGLLPSAVITTVAGNGSESFCGDGGPATQACLAAPWGLFVDPAGNLYIADPGEDRVRRVAPDGTITTVAGNGSRGFCGDGGPATQACLNIPDGLFVDADRNLYISDDLNNRVRRVAPDGTITTVAGNGSSSFCGDGGPATQACLYNPHGLFVDPASNLYIADAGNNRVQRVAPDGTITTVAGNGSSSFCGDGGPATQACLNIPDGLFVDPAGNLYIADQGNNRVRRMAPDGTITTVAGNGSSSFCGDGGPATQACLYAPMRLFVDAAGNLYIADRINNRVRLVAAPSDGTHGGAAKNYVALGDSYSSGEGLGPYRPDSILGSDKCDRSDKAYGPQLATAARLTLTAFVACSGAVTADITNPNHRNPEGAQTLFLPASTRVVTLTIGGNDAGFVDILDKCIHDPVHFHVGGYGCKSNKQFTDDTDARIKTLAGQGTPGMLTPDKNHTTEIKSISSVLQAIHSQAGNATIYIAGYPTLFSVNKENYKFVKGHPKTRGAPEVEDHYIGDVGSGASVKFEDAQWINGEVAKTNAAIKQAADATGGWAVFVDVTAKFFDGHALLDSPDPWINGLKVHSDVLDPASFHPTETGQLEGYEAAFQAVVK